ncbi:MAG: ATP-binding cassette domain-containing protein [Oligoflexales bacterium]|nr:ATP-binding cassette domain-containing protein [Oligoflexales bacterium]
MEEKILEVSDMKIHFPVYKGLVFRKQTACVKAVDGISIDLKQGETLGLVGESGCGKSTFGRTVMRLYDPTAGRIRLNGKDITHLSGSDLEEFRVSCQMIFQDPYASLNPRMTVFDIIAEPLRTHKIFGSRQELEKEINELMNLVGLSPRYIKKYPHEFSGGQRQRIAIARALAIKPKLIVCDEPVSALDVSIQSQIINLLIDLQKELGLSYIFIAHDIAVVKHISDRIAVMYL